MLNKIQTAEPGGPVDEPIKHTDGDFFSDTIYGYDRNGEPIDFTGMTFHMQFGTHKRFDPEEKLFEIPTENFTITQDENGLAAGVMNQLNIEMADPFFAENGHYFQYTRLFDAAGRQFTIRGSKFIIDH